MNPNAFTDLFKNAVDFNQLFAAQRRNIEAFSDANRLVVESAQAIARRGAEVTRENVEGMLKASKEMLTSGSPETNISRQTELARNIFETALSNLREMSEMVAKSGFEAFDVLNKRAAESMEEVSRASSAAQPKRKNAA